jgi:ABC-type transport system involved in multi-copper enzyme maturation permease subunit
MRPYLAVLRDSFHEALVSRVLWILLLLTTVFLVALSPLGVTQQAGSFLIPTDLHNPTAFLNKVAEQSQSPQPSPGRRIWDQLSTHLQAKITARQDPSANFEATYALRNELNELLKKADFFDADAWKDVKLPNEAQKLLEQGLDKLPADELARFNRLALQSAFPDEIAKGHRKQIQLTYFHWELGLPLPIEREQLRPAINSILVALMTYLLGVGGILIAILVTASLIPQTFEPGAIDLLLSKPNLRILVFLTKFVGGCAFTLVNASYFIIGLWLIVGFRFGLWNMKLLWCIPIYMFLFAIYYSVSALAGVFWRNAVLSVVMTIVFWVACWSLGLAKNLVEILALNPQRITRLVPAGETLLAVNESGEVLQWDEADRIWQRVFFDENSRPSSPFRLDNSMIGPVYQPS